MCRKLVSCADFKAILTPFSEVVCPPFKEEKRFQITSPSKRRPVLNACAQPYHPGSGSHGELFRPCWTSSAWHSRRAAIGLKALCSLPSTAELGSKHPFSASSRQHMWELVAGNRMAVLPLHALGRWISLDCRSVCQ